MTISGGIKFFQKNFVDIDFDGASVVCSTGVAYSDYLRNRNNIDKWTSVGSNDATTETIELRFAASTSVNRLLLVGHNWKAFTAKYWNGAAWTHFATVVTKEGSQTNITETANAKTTSYYEFAAVTTDKIQVSITTTLTTNAEKTAAQVIATTEIGTFAGYPQWTPSFDKNQVENRSVNGRPKYSIMGETFSAEMRFDGYPTTNDHAMIQTLWDDEEEFLVWLCGGNDTQFRYPAKGNRLQDIYLVWFGNVWSPSYANTVYQSALSYDLRLNEVA